MTGRVRGRRNPFIGRDTVLILIERRVVSEPVIMEMEKGGHRPRPTGFWRGTKFHEITRVLSRRGERGVAYLRVLSDRGCFDIRRVTEIDPWTWKSKGRWEIVAELSAIPVKRISS
jgi:hypothetical protein